jgi:predicted DNA-binding transcriptional regulator AlpA
MQSSSATDEQFLPAREVLARYSISNMSCHRWLRHPRLEFPKPIYINKRRYWRLSDLVAWERSRCSQSLDINVAPPQDDGGNSPPAVPAQLKRGREGDCTLSDDQNAKRAQR